MKKVIQFISGILLLILGIICLVTPGPGWLFIFMGLSLIAPSFARRLKLFFMRKFFKSKVLYFEDWQKQNAHAGVTTKHFELKVQNSNDFKNLEIQDRFKLMFASDKVVLDHGITHFERFAFLNQTHSDILHVLDDETKLSQPGFYFLGEGDGLITNIKNLHLIAFTADCLSIYFKAGNWVGLVHAGWRGTKAQIAAKAFTLIREKSGIPAEDIFMILGPSIRFKAYEVGKEFKQNFPRSVRKVKGHWHFDLVGENKRQLKSAGALEKNIADYEICTVKENESFYSFRKEGEDCGRMISFISAS